MYLYKTVKVGRNPLWEPGLIPIGDVEMEILERIKKRRRRNPLWEPGLIPIDLIRLRDQGLSYSEIVAIPYGNRVLFQ